MEVAEHQVPRRGHDAHICHDLSHGDNLHPPCERAITHNNAEDCAPEDYSAGLNVLLHAAASRADR